MIYNGFVYDGCVFDRNRSATPFCATKLTDEPEFEPEVPKFQFMEDNWGSCGPNCLRASKKSIIFVL